MSFSREINRLRYRKSIEWQNFEIVRSFMGGNYLRTRIDFEIVNHNLHFSNLAS